MINAQAFEGKGDIKLNIGMAFQHGGNGIMAINDFGLGENFSVGILASYLLSGDNIGQIDFDKRFDAKLRFNANIGNVINISPKFDLYPGLNLGIKNFGGHIGARYFFVNGFGLFTEFSAPFVKYDRDAATIYNNDNTFNVGVSFNLN